VTLPSPPLLVITDRHQARAPLVEVVEAACEGGCRWFSIREKDLALDEQRALSEQLRVVTQRFGARLTIHANVAAASMLDGVHLGAGADAAAARAALGADALIGISVHNSGEVAQVSPAVDYMIAGPAFETASKPGYGPALGPEGLRHIAAAATVPLIGIGGITPFNVGVMLSAGAYGVAVMGGIMRARDPAREVRRLIAALEIVRTRDHLKPQAAR
jgi:thiamine-phosphate pyrophosphorylase